MGCAVDERDREVRFLRGTKHAVQPKRKKPPGEGRLRYLRVLIELEVDQSTGGYFVEVVRREAAEVYIDGIDTKMAILNPQRHRCSVDFLHGTEAPHFDFAVSDKPTVERPAAINIDDAVAFCTLILAVQDGMTKRVPTLPDTAFEVPGIVRCGTAIKEVEMTVSTVNE